MKPFAFILLLLHINFSMFIAQVDETDTYDASGQQMTDINSLSDWLQASLSSHKPVKHKSDSDDDNARYFHALKPHHFFSPYFLLVKKAAVPNTTAFAPALNDNQLLAGFFDIQSPPPKA